MDGLALRLTTLRRASWRGYPPAIALPLLVGFAYYAGSLLGFALRFPSSGISFLWPPTAILTASLLLTAPRTWSACLAGALVAHGAAHSQDGLPAATWLCQFAANGVQAVLAAFLVRRYSAAPPLFRDLRGVAVFIVGAAVVAPAAASLIAAYVYVSMGWASDLWHAWRARVLSNLIASLTLVPPIVLGFYRLRSGRATIQMGRLIEFGLLLLALLVAYMTATQVQDPNASGLPLALYAPAPFLLWATVRFGQAGLSCALLCTSLMTISSALGQSPFAETKPADTVIAVQVFIGMTAVPLMLLAGLLEERRAEGRTLLESEQKTSAILRAIPDVMFLQSRAGVYLDCYARNPADLLMPPDLFLGRNMRDVLPPDLTATFLHAFQQVGMEEPAIAEYALPIDGQLRHFEARCVGLAPDRILSIVRDITDRTRSQAALRESQQRYALATAAGGVDVWDWDLTTRQLYLGPALKAALGFEERELAGDSNSWERLVYPPDLEDLGVHIRSHADGHSPRLEVEHRMVHKDGSIRWFLMRGEITERVERRAVRITGTYTDVTGRREAEAALKQARDDLVRMARLTALGELTASIAHELNQPLCAIVANANACLNWLEHASLEPEVRAALNDVVHDSHRASAIVRRTRELFTNRPPQRTPLNLNETVREVLELIRGRLQRRHIELELSLDETLPLVSADEVQVQQVLFNLVQNGLDAMRDIGNGRRALRVRSRRRRASAVISVRDTGKGLSPGDVGRVFDPFYTTKPEGLGIGLAISRSIITAHGGVLWATANACCGATFWFKIPAMTGDSG